MTKLPESVKIGPYVYVIEEKPDVRTDGSDCWGFCSFEPHAILIRATCPQDRKKAVLMHEVLHATYELLGLPKKATEEQVCTSLGPLLVQVLTDNPGFVEYVTCNE